MNRDSIRLGASDRVGRMLAMPQTRLVLAGAFLACLAMGYRSRNDEPLAVPPPGPDSGSRASQVHDSAAQVENGRGRDARSPSQIPAAGWKDIFWRVYIEIGDDRLIAVAAGVTFYALLAIFPAIGAFVSLYGLFNDPGTVEDQLALLQGVIPAGGIEVIEEQLKRVTVQGDGALGFGFIFGLSVALWSANAGMKAVFDALNVVYHEREKRSFIKLNLVSLTFTLGGILFVATAISTVIVMPAVIEYFGLRNATEGWLKLLRWPLLLVVSGFMIALIYRFGPSRELARWRWVTWGSAFATILWLGGSALFSWYVASFGNYNETYGSLGAVIGFMTWIWLSTVILLVGAEINAEMEHQTAFDTTTGPDRPQGSRGATMADTVGARYGK